MSSPNKPRVIILGGCGFIGRNLVQFLVENGLCSAIRVVDKILPRNFWLNPAHRTAMSSPIVEFIYADLSDSKECKEIFKRTERYQGPWDFVINCAGESRFDLNVVFYERNIYTLSMNCARAAARQNIKRFIEISSGFMNTNEKEKITEECRIQPWVRLAKFKYFVERDLGRIKNLKYTIIRLPFVYGLGDIRYISPRIVLAAVYKYFSKDMVLLWDPELTMDTVHVTDVASAIWFLCHRPEAENQIYNLCDESDTTQGTLSEILSDIFEIKTEYIGLYNSLNTKIQQENFIREEYYGQTFGLWKEICEKSGINHSPLSPVVPLELLNNQFLALDSTKIRTLGFHLRVPKLTHENIIAVLRDFINQEHFPAHLINISHFYQGNIPRVVSANVPSTSRDTASTSRDIPSTSRDIPSTSRGIPSTSRDIPSTSRDIPSTSRAIPSTSRDIPSTSRDIPSTSRGISSTSRDYPGTFRDIPSTSRGIPGTFRDVPSTSRGIPGTFRDIPSTSRDIPCTSRDIPSTSRGIPSTSRDIPSTSRGFSSAYSSQDTYYSCSDSDNNQYIEYTFNLPTSSTFKIISSPPPLLSTPTPPSTPPPPVSYLSTFSPPPISSSSNVTLASAPIPPPAAFASIPMPPSTTRPPTSTRPSNTTRPPTTPRPPSTTRPSTTITPPTTTTDSNIYHF